MIINKERISEYIINDDLETAVKYLLLISQIFDTSLFNESIQVSARLNNLNRQVSSGIISQQDSQITRNKIRSSISYVKNKLDDSWNTEVEDKPIPDPVPAKKINRGNDNGNSAPEKIKILFMSANSDASKRLNFDQEFTNIEESIKRSKFRDRFILISKWAVRIKDMRRVMVEESPNYVHFSGHGTRYGKLHFLNKAGDAQPVSAEALGRFFANFKDSVKCVLLNACFSMDQAEEITNHIEYVIGMNDEMPDDAALEFSEAFYDSIGAGRDTLFAFKIACNAIDLYDLKKEDVPELKIKGQGAE